MPGAIVRRGLFGRRFPGLRTASAAGLGLVLLMAGPASADTQRNSEWWLDALGATQAWQTTKGKGITIAVLDTGVDAAHPDLAGQVKDGSDFTVGNRKPGGKLYGHHGTWAAALAAGHGHGNAGGDGIVGIAPEAQILPVRVTWDPDDPMRSGKAAAARDRDALARGIRYAADQGAQVIDLSLVGSAFSSSAADLAAVQYAENKGAVLVAAMGDQAGPAARKYYPAAYPGVIAVGGVGRNLKAWKDSDRGSYVTVAAPAVGITSADAGAGYQTADGTSAASALVAGVVALVRAKYPKMASTEVALTIARAVTHQPKGGHSEQIGQGVVDAAKALTVAAGMEATSSSSSSAGESSVPSDKSVNVLLIGVLGGGGLLVVIGLVLGYLQRRNSPEEQVEEYEPLEPETELAPLAAPVAAEPPAMPTAVPPRRAPMGDVSVAGGPSAARRRQDAFAGAAEPPQDRGRPPGRAPNQADARQRPAEQPYRPPGRGLHRAEPAPAAESTSADATEPDAPAVRGFDELRSYDVSVSGPVGSDESGDGFDLPPLPAFHDFPDLRWDEPEAADSEPVAEPDPADATRHDLVALTDFDLDRASTGRPPAEQSDDDRETASFPAVGPVSDPAEMGGDTDPGKDLPIRRIRPRAGTRDEDDFRPPWL